MSRAIAVMGESGNGKSTAMRNLPPNETYYIDCDGKGLSWKGWRNQYNAENKNYTKTDNQQFLRMRQMMATHLLHTLPKALTPTFLRTTTTQQRAKVFWYSTDDQQPSPKGHSVLAAV